MKLLFCYLVSVVIAVCISSTIYVIAMYPLQFARFVLFAVMGILICMVIHIIYLFVKNLIRLRKEWNQKINQE